LESRQFVSLSHPFIHDDAGRCFLFELRVNLANFVVELLELRRECRGGWRVVVLVAGIIRVVDVGEDRLRGLFGSGGSHAVVRVGALP
jgi:hypothetical protein